MKDNVIQLSDYRQRSTEEPLPDYATCMNCGHRYKEGKGIYCDVMNKVIKSSFDKEPHSEHIKPCFMWYEGEGREEEGYFED